MSLTRQYDVPSGLVTLRFALPDDNPDAPVSVVGSFNDWTPGEHVLEADGDGQLAAIVVVEPGIDVHFRYLGTDGVWFDEWDADEIWAEGCVVHVDAPVAEESSVAEPVEAPADAPKARRTPRIVTKTPAKRASKAAATD